MSFLHESKEEYTEIDTIFSVSPGVNEQVDLEKAYKLAWNASLLQYFDEDVGTGGHGASIICPLVSLYLVGENEVSVDASSTDNTTTGLPSGRRILKSSIPNSGSSTVVFHSNSTTLGSKFYILIQCATKTSVSSWSAGYFYFAPLPVPISSTLINTTAVISRNLRPKVVDFRNTAPKPTMFSETTELSSAAEGLFDVKRDSFRRKYELNSYHADTMVYRPQSEAATVTCLSNQVFGLIYIFKIHSSHLCI